MPLIKSISEVAAVLPKLTSHLNNDSLLPNFAAAEEKYLVPIIGNALYEDLQTKYNDNDLSDSEGVLLSHIQLLVASYGFLDELAASHVLITDGGIRTQSTGDYQKAVGWEYKELKSFLSDRVCDATEVLLHYLFSHKNDLALWTASDAYKSFKGLLIRTGIDFAEQYKLYQPMRNFYALKSLMRDQQDSYITSGIGEDLLNYFLAKEAPSDDEKKILQQLKKALAYFTIKHTTEYYAVKFNDSGFSILSVRGGDHETGDSGLSAATVNSIERLHKACDRDGKNFMAHAKGLLIDLRKSFDTTNDFTTAFDKGPLVKKLTPTDYTSGNDKRKIFRF